jgi:hypothetical protein
MHRTGTYLARLGGADPDVLARAKQISKPGASKDQARFVALGLVLLATAALAVLSMTFAMTDGLHVGVAGAVVVGILWGAIILIVDRALILSLKPKGSKWLLFWMILPRIGMAALLGAVISTPLTLRIFNDEIEHQMAIDNIKKAEAASQMLSEGDRQKKLQALQEDITRYEGYLNGNVPVTSPDLVASESEYKQAEDAYKAKQADAEKAWAAWRCELDGQLCEAGSGKVGNGPRAQALKREYDRKEADANAAKSLVAEKLAALEAARAGAKQANGDKVAQAQAEAKRVLPDLRKQRDALQAAIQNDLGTSNREAAEDTGLLARLVALSNLGEDNGWARLAHLLVAALLFMLELLPVAVKSLSILGPPSAYDQIDDLDTKEVVRSAGRQEYIDRDLEKRKKRIAEEVHKEVEVVMRDIAIAQVKRWKDKVNKMTVPATAPNGGPPPNGSTQPATAPTGGPPPNGSAQPAGTAPGTVPGQRTSNASQVTATLNLPPSGNNTP